MEILIHKIGKKENLIKHTAFFLFLLLALLIGSHHEPWADEAQSWLIARDTGFKDLFSVMSYEGSPALWPLILKIFIFLGLTYPFLYLVPFFFSSLGVGLLIYKAKLPLAVRVALPFTYYIFYQYTIVARSYCLILPAIELIALLYDNRLRNPCGYGLMLILLSGICLHTLLLSGVLYLLFCWDVFRTVIPQNHKIQIICNECSAFAVGVSYLFTIWYAKPPSDCSFHAGFETDLTKIPAAICERIGEAFLFSSSTLFWFLLFAVVLVLIFMFYYRITLRFCIVAFPIWIFLSCFYCNQWHIGMIFLSVLLACQLYPPEPKFSDMRIHRCLFALLGIILGVQISWSVRTSFYDYREAYSGAGQAAEFIKANYDGENKIYGLGYFSTGLEPYFESNIFRNRNTAYYFWSDFNGDWTNQRIRSNMPDVIVYAECESAGFQDIINVLQSGGYQCRRFQGASYVKDGIYESQTYYVYVKLRS